MPTALLYTGNSLDVLKELADESVQMCVTSPPYWGLRGGMVIQSSVWQSNGNRTDSSVKNLIGENRKCSGPANGSDPNISKTSAVRQTLQVISVYRKVRFYAGCTYTVYRDVRYRNRGRLRSGVHPVQQIRCTVRQVHPIQIGVAACRQIGRYFTRQLSGNLHRHLCGNVMTVDANDANYGRMNHVIQNFMFIILYLSHARS